MSVLLHDPEKAADIAGDLQEQVRTACAHILATLAVMKTDEDSIWNTGESGKLAPLEKLIISVYKASFAPLGPIGKINLYVEYDEICRRFQKELWNIQYYLDYIHA